MIITIISTEIVFALLLPSSGIHIKIRVVCWCVVLVAIDQGRYSDLEVVVYALVSSCNVGRKDIE